MNSRRAETTVIFLSTSEPKTELDTSYVLIIMGMWIDGWVCGWMDGGVDGWVGGRMDGWVDGWSE